MKKFDITVSQNGWEYEGHTFITCKDIQRIGDRRILVDGNIEIEFDEEFYINQDSQK